MAVKAGYKRTEAGVIPDGWGVNKLGEIGNVRMCKRVLKQQTRSHGDVPFYKIGTFGGIPDAYISQSLFDEIKRKYSFPKRGDVLISAAGTIGRTVVFDGEDAYFQDSNIVWIENDESKVTNDYLKYRYQVTKWLVSHGGTVARLYNDSLRTKISLPVPPLSEQRAIAVALSDVDALLGGLDRLIAKKRNLKQATMQQLLTGQTRLPGFSGEWEVKSLGEIAHIKTGSRNNEDKVEDGAYPFYVRSDVVERINSYSYDCEAILVPGEGRIGSIFHYIEGRFDVHQRVYAVTQFEPGVSGKFVHLYMAMNFGAWAMQNTVKATVDSLRLPTFQTFQMRMPPTKDEQLAIATVLSDMDAELEALEQRRAKTLALKQAMMQELLTGRTRLI